MERKRSCEIESLLKKYNVKNSSTEKLAAMESNVFLKSGRSKKVALQKNWVMRNIAFLKN